MSETAISYDAAIKELEAMVARFEQAEIGVDELVGQIKRAGVLIKTCRQRLRVVEDEMQGAIEELVEEEAKTDTDTGVDDAGDPFDDAPQPAKKASRKASSSEPGGLFEL